MNALRITYHLARADFLERVRRSSFFVLLAATVFISYLFVPPAGSPIQTVALGNARGIYNSAWVGTMFGMLISMLVTLFVFYVIKNAVSRDHQTQVGQIIAATPMHKVFYVLGKWSSNLTLLLLLMCVMTLVAGLMQMVRAEDTNLDLVSLVVPLWLMGLPALALVAALAVLFECTPLLRGGIGNVVYYFLFMLLSVFFLYGMTGEDGLSKPTYEPYGISYALADMQQTIMLYDVDYDGELVIGGAEMSPDALIFPWRGIQWNLIMILARLSWIGVAAFLAILAALPFDRFDPARMGSRRRIKPIKEFTATNHAKQEHTETRANVSLTPLTQQHYRSRFPQLFFSELLLLVKGHHWWWYAVILGLNIACLAVPSTIRHYLLAAAWFWPILLWSGMGNREKSFDTRQMVFSTPQPLLRQFAAQWLAGVVISMLAGAGYGLGMLFSAQPDAFLAWCAGAVFIPSLALALGVWSGSRRAFEIIYTFLWYIGPINGVAALDFMGVTQQALHENISQFYWLAAAGFLIIAFLGRSMQIRK